MTPKSPLEVATEDLENLTRFISHDLRSPIRSIIGFSNLLLDQSPQVFDDSAISNIKTNIKKIIGVAQRTQLLIDSMLTYTRLSERKIQVCELDLTRICTEVCSSIVSNRKNIHSKPIDILITPNLKAQGDKTLITVMLENLIDNALKFASKNETVKIQIGSTTTPKGNAFFIQDNGVGFDMAHAQYLFTPFELLHNQEKYSGIGMGLPISKKIIDLHNGAIWFDSKVNSGTTFYFQI